MKQINLHVPFRSFDGKEIMEEGKPKMIDEMVCALFFNGSFLKPTNDPDSDARIKMRAYNLYRKIADARGNVELETEDLALIKQAAAALNPGGYGQIVEIIEN